LTRLGQVVDISVTILLKSGAGGVTVKPGHKAGGQHAYFRAIRGFFNWLEQAGEIESKRRDSRDMKRELGRRDQTVMLASLNTGARAGEMTALNVGNIDLKTGSVVIRQGPGLRFGG
jgi:integrase